MLFSFFTVIVVCSGALSFVNFPNFFLAGQDILFSYFNTRVQRNVEACWSCDRLLLMCWPSLSLPRWWTATPSHRRTPFFAAMLLIAKANSWRTRPHKTGRKSVPRCLSEGKQLFFPPENPLAIWRPASDPELKNKGSWFTQHKAHVLWTGSCPLLLYQFLLSCFLFQFSLCWLDSYPKDVRVLESDIITFVSFQNLR